MSFCGQIHIFLSPTKPLGRDTDDSQRAFLGLCPSLCGESHHPSLGEKERSPSKWQTLQLALRVPSSPPPQPRAYPVSLPCSKYKLSPTPWESLPSVSLLELVFVESKDPRLLPPAHRGVTERVVISPALRRHMFMSATCFQVFVPGS